VRSVNIHEAKTHLSRLVEDASEGEEIVIAKAGKPMARLVPVEPKRKRRKLGWLRGKLEVPETFDAPLPDEVMREFEGRDDASPG
jgi:prevent-host-death family protein